MHLHERGLKHLRIKNKKKLSDLLWQKRKKEPPLLVNHMT